MSPLAIRLSTALLALILLVGSAPGATAAVAPPTECTISGVDDAATLRLRCPAGDRSLRLLAVRAPRPGLPQRGGEPFGDESLALARRTLLGRRVALAAGTVLLAGEDLRVLLLSGGLVSLAPTTARPPAALQAAERAARLAGHGLWSAAIWQQHRAAAASPLDLPTPSAPEPEPLGARAARLTRRTPAQRRADFAAALAELSNRPAEETTAGDEPAGTEASDDGDQ